VFGVLCKPREGDHGTGKAQYSKPRVDEAAFVGDGGASGRRGERIEIIFFMLRDLVISLSATCRNPWKVAGLKSAVLPDPRIRFLPG
jgi:hypothetical protein